MSEIVAGFLVDGKVFETRKEAQDYVRRPKIAEALKNLSASEEQIAWLLDNMDSVEAAFEAGAIRRVTKSESNKLRKAMEHLIALEDPKLSFIAENSEAIIDSFRWPSVKRMSAEEKASAARVSLVSATGDEGFAEWIIANQSDVMEAFKAGIEKREVSSKATEALAAYRARRAAEKAEEDAARAEGDEAYAALMQRRAAEKAAAESEAAQA